MPGGSAWPTSYDYNWCENTTQGQTKTGTARLRTPLHTPIEPIHFFFFLAIFNCRR